MGTTITYYKPYERLDTNKKPQFMCPQENDKFTGTNTSLVGNQELKERAIGFLTVDEYAYAGGLIYANSQYNYLYQNAQEGSNSSYWWLGSASCFSGSNAYGFAVVGDAEAPGYFESGDVSYGLGFRPVISLKADTIVTSGSDATAYNVD